MWMYQNQMCIPWLLMAYQYYRNGKDIPNLIEYTH